MWRGDRKWNWSCIKGDWSHEIRSPGEQRWEWSMQWYFLCYCMGTKPGQYRRGKRNFHPSSPSLSRSSSTYAKTASLMFSRDSLVCHLATQRTLAEASVQRQAFKPFQQVIEMMQENPGASPWQHKQKAEWQRWIHQSVLSSVGPSQYRDRLWDSLRTDPQICGPKPFSSHQTTWCGLPWTPWQTLSHTMQSCTCGGEAIIQVSAVSWEADPPACAQSLQCGSGEAALQWEARWHSLVTV